MITPYERILRMYMNGKHETALAEAYRLMEDLAKHSTLPTDESIECANFLLLVGSVCHRARLLDNARDFYRGVMRVLEGQPMHAISICARFNLASAVAPCDLAEARALHCQVRSAVGGSEVFRQGLQIQHARLFGSTAWTAP
jgi:hypothetical protein